MSDLIQFTMSSHQSHDEVYALLDAHMAHEHTKAIRQFCVHVLAVVGGLIALCLLFPDQASPQLQAMLLALWGACCVCSLMAAGMEWKWQRREARLLAANQAAPQS